MSDRTWDSDGKAGEALRYIVSTFGETVCMDGERLRSTLSDVLPGDASIREKSLLVAAARAGVAADIKANLAAGMSLEGAVQLGAQRLADAQPFDSIGCTWVTSQFASALTGTAMPVAAGGRGMPVVEALDTNDVVDFVPIPPVFTPEATDLGRGDRTMFPSQDLALGGPAGSEVRPDVGAPRIAALDFVRRPLTLWVLSVAAVVYAISQPITNSSVNDALQGASSVLVAVALFIGASWARVPVTVRRLDARDLMFAAIGSAVTAVGWFLQSIANRANGSATLFNIGTIVEVVGVVAVAVVIISLGVAYRAYRAGRQGRSPTPVLVGAAVGAILWQAPDLYGLTWINFNPNTVKFWWGAVEGAGALVIGLSLLLAAVWSFGPPLSLALGGIGSIVMGITQIRLFYSSDVHLGTYYAIGASIICAGVVLIAYQVTSGRTSIAGVRNTAGPPPSVAGAPPSAGQAVPAPQSRATSDGAAVLVAKRTVLVGAGIIVAGIVILVVTYKLTSTRFFYFGPIVVGVLVMYRGARSWMRLSRRDASGSAPGATPGNMNLPTAAPPMVNPQPAAAGAASPLVASPPAAAQAVNASQAGPSPVTAPPAPWQASPPPVAPGPVTAPPASSPPEATAPPTIDPAVTIGPASGNPSPVPHIPAPAFCPGCGSRREEGARFCVACGQPFSSLPE